MKHSRLVPVILALALIAGGGLRVAGIMGKKTIGVDEGISFLSATGHEKTYHNIITEKTPPYGTPVPASEWKQFVRPDKIFCFKEISNALADYDVHPPLYFWFLHIWFLVFGASIISGTILNLLFFLLSIFALFYLARDCLKNPLEASLIALVWAMSPAVIQVSWVIRSYGLLILCVILLVRLTYLSLDSEEVQRRRDYIFLMLITAAGLLTHYSFLFPLAGAAFFLLYTLRRELRRLVTAYLFIGGGVLTAALVHPHYYRSFIFQQYQTRNSPYGSLTFRLEKVTSGFLDFIVGNRGIQKIVLVVAIIIVIWLGIAYLVKRHKEFQAARKIDFTGVSILYFLFWTGGLTTTLYLIGINSMQQMGRRYLSLTYPFLAFIPILFFRFLGRAKITLTICFFTFLFLSAGTRVYRFRKSGADLPENSGVIQSSGLIVIDTTWRGFIPRLLHYIPDDKILFIADHDYLLRHPDKWLNSHRGSFIYISTDYKIYDVKRKKLIQTIGQTREIELIEDRISGNGIAYHVGPLIFSLKK